MKKILFSILLSILLNTVSHSQSLYEGKWVAYDTLSIEKTQLGSMTINKVKLYHKVLEFDTAGKYSMTHIEPKGFFIDANVSGTWKESSSGIVLTYKDRKTNEKGVSNISSVLEEYKRVGKDSISFIYNDKVMIFIKE